MYFFKPEPYANNLVNNYIEPTIFNTFTFCFMSQGQGGCSMGHAHCWDAMTCTSIATQLPSSTLPWNASCILQKRCSAHTFANLRLQSVSNQTYETLYSIGKHYCMLLNYRHANTGFATSADLVPSRWPWGGLFFHFYKAGTNPSCIHLLEISLHPAPAPIWILTFCEFACQCIVEL